LNVIFQRISDKQYFLRIKNEKPDAIAKLVRGFITIEGTKVDYKPLLWENNRKEYFDIGYQGDLFLFSFCSLVAAAFLVFSRYATVIAKLPKPMEFKLSEGTITIVLP
jgi:hypothetical protein